MKIAAREGAWGPALGLAVLVLSLAAGCINEDRVIHRVELQGTIDSAVDGPVWLDAHHRDRGEGELATHLGLVASWELDGIGAFAVELDYPEGEGEGLLLYGFVDLDGDGLLCALGADPEPAGLVEVTGVPEDPQEVTLVLDRDCLGAELLWP